MTGVGVLLSPLTALDTSCLRWLAGLLVGWLVQWMFVCCRHPEKSLTKGHIKFIGKYGFVCCCFHFHFHFLFVLFYFYLLYAASLTTVNAINTTMHPRYAGIPTRIKYTHTYTHIVYILLRCCTLHLLHGTSTVISHPFAAN